MGNNASKPEDDVCFEGKFFTTGDGIKLSSSVVKRLSQDEREAKEHRAKLEAQAKAQADERAQKSAEEQAILDNKFNDLERSHQEQRIMLEKERDRNYQMMNEYDELVGNREMQIHKLLLDLEGEREKFAEAIRNREENFTKVCDSWNDKLAAKETEYEQLESRLKEKESTLSDVTNKLSAEIQAEKDKLSGYQEIFADRVQLMEDQFKFVVDGVVRDFLKHQDEIKARCDTYAGELDAEKVKLDSTTGDFAAQIKRHENQLSATEESFVSRLQLHADKFSEALRGFDAQIDLHQAKLGHVTEEFAGRVGDAKNQLGDVASAQSDLFDRIRSEEEKFSAVTADLSQQISAERHKFVEVTNCLTEQIHHEQDKLEQISTVAYQEFEDAAKKIEEKFQPAGSKAVCSDTESSLLECYKTNPRKPLLCNKQLQHFKECVAASKKEMFARRGLASE